VAPRQPLSKAFPLANNCLVTDLDGGELAGAEAQRSDRAQQTGGLSAMQDQGGISLVVKSGPADEGVNGLLHEALLAGPYRENSKRLPGGAWYRVPFDRVDQSARIRHGPLACSSEGKAA